MPSHEHAQTRATQTPVLNFQLQRINFKTKEQHAIWRMVMQARSPKYLKTCNHMTSLYPLEKQFINVTCMQGIWNINPNQDQFTSSVRPSTGLARKENKAYLNFLLVPIIPIPMLMLKICPSNLIKINPTNQKNQNASP